jgi:hypothetical protein
MMSPSRPESPPASRLATILTVTTLFAALVWLVSRVWLGLDFEDEMQYYGQIASLTRTGRFFQDDLFLQQLGYLFVLPFFKLHALVFPDQSYLMVFGRLLLLAAYGVTGGLFWRAASKLGGFSRLQKLASVAVFFAWVPFQIFAFSYNTTAYLLTVILVAVWIVRDPGKFPRYAVIAAGLLTLLTYTHPSVGLGLILTATLEATWQRGWRAGLQLMLATAGFGLAVLATMRLLHGPAFWQDLLDAINFTRSFGMAEVIRRPVHVASWLGLLALGGVFVWRQRFGRTFNHPLGPQSPFGLRWAVLCLLVVGCGALLGLLTTWKIGYSAACAYLGLLMLLAVSIGPADGQALVLRFTNAALLRRVMIIALDGGCAAILLIMVLSMDVMTGYYAITVYGVLLLLLAATATLPEAKILIALVLIGSVAGAVSATTSGNGISNFGIGVAGVLPYLALYGTRQMEKAKVVGGPLIVPALAVLLLVNGMLNPYGEQAFWRTFLPIKDVPAFRGIRTSALKIEAIGRFKPVAANGAMQGKHILIIGPHPWLYFVLGGQPATPILFMKFDGKPQAYELVADRLFREGLPDVVIITSSFMPPPIGAKVQSWSKQDCFVTTVPIPDGFNYVFMRHVGYGFSPTVFVLSRTRTPP